MTGCTGGSGASSGSVRPWVLSANSSPSSNSSKPVRLRSNPASPSSPISSESISRSQPALSASWLSKSVRVGEVGLGFLALARRGGRRLGNGLLLPFSPAGQRQQQWSLASIGRRARRATRVRPDWVINVEAAAALLPKSGNSARRLLRCSKPATRRAGLKIAFRLAQREVVGANVNRHYRDRYRTFTSAGAPVGAEETPSP